MAEFEKLEKDKAKGGRRDMWLALEGKFATLESNSKGDQAAIAAFYRARARQELGSRSYLASDHKKAAELFGATADRYPKHRLASESLLGQASILQYRLDDTGAAQKVLARLASDYPNSKEAGVARKRLGALEAGLSKTPSGGNVAPKGAPGSVMEQLGLTVRTIMLDAGHGGKDPGAMAGGVTECQFTLSMANRVGALLAKKGFNILYTRGGNKFIPLPDRPDIANNQKADLFISFHINANNNSAVRGLETYYLDGAKTRDAAVVAARENAVSVENISDLQFILTDLMLSYKVKESRHLARCVHRGILKKLRGSKFPTHDNGVRSAPFYVLMGARMPAILVEFGYITNKDDLIGLKDEKYLQSQAEGLVEGILLYQKELGSTVPR